MSTGPDLPLNLPWIEDALGTTRRCAIEHLGILPSPIFLLPCPRCSHIARSPLAHRQLPLEPQVLSARTPPSDHPQLQLLLLDVSIPDLHLTTPRRYHRTLANAIDRIEFGPDFLVILG